MTRTDLSDMRPGDSVLGALGELDEFTVAEVGRWLNRSRYALLRTGERVHWALLKPNCAELLVPLRRHAK